MRRFALWTLLATLAACAGNPDRQTIGELRRVQPELAELDVTDSLDKAMQAYRQYLSETPTNVHTPEALRRLADLQIEKEYGTLVGNEVVELPAPARGEFATDGARVDASRIATHAESQESFEARAAATGAPVPARDMEDIALPGTEAAPAAAGPREAIATYRRILEQYPHYARNDQVLYQMARAYDELGETEEAMAVMLRLIREFPASEYLDEVYFRRGEYFFVRRKYLDAEDAYTAVTERGPGSQFYELALYKLGWAFYKQDLYEEALHNYMALLDHKLAEGYDFDGAGEEDEERRVADTFRVISLGFSNLGGPEVLNEYFAAHGKRSYEDRIYSNLAEFYVDKLRFNDAAVVYRSFVELNPLHKVAPHFSMRVAEVYADGGFPMLVVESKKDFAERYGLDAEYWQHYDVAAMPDVLEYLKTNLKDLAQHFHALYQEEALAEEQATNYAEALTWYRQFLASFPSDAESPAINFQLADLHLEESQFDVAALEYERTAYDYPPHERSAAAGYAAIYAHREHLAVLDEAEQGEVKRATVASSLRFANTFPDHEHAAAVLGAATDDLYVMQDYAGAIDAGMQLIEQHPDAEQALRRAAWLAVAHSHFDLEAFADAEHGYGQVLTLTAEEDESRQELFENLAAAIYKQGELANEAADFAQAADHFLRIKALAPTSAIRPAAEYDAAVALVSLEDWLAAGDVLEDFRATHEEHELQPEVTKQLAFVYQQAGELSRSADEYRRVAADSVDPDVKSESMLVAGKLYRDAGNRDSALAVYREHVETFAEPVEVNVETRFAIAELLLEQQAIEAYHRELEQIVRVDAEAGGQRTDRTRYLGAKSALVLAETTYARFASMALTLPFEQSLEKKKAQMDTLMAELEALVDYEVAEVTSAATFYIAETYRNFSNALLESERPAGMDGAERAEYDLVLEEEAYPFEERSIEVHQENIELMMAGTHNAWLEKSLTELATLMPGRYAKFETSAGYIGSIDFYAYRSPLAEVLTAERNEQDEPAASDEAPSVSADESDELELTSAY